ncbi:ankyrin repeat domain-containing protein [Burkholderia cenocepacia]|nr:ankyrin repeat domain-containing protein [Burkholderia cenocepacia]
MRSRTKKAATVLARGVACLCAGMALSSASYALEGKEWKLMVAMGDYAADKTPRNLARVSALLKQGARPYDKTAKQRYAMPDAELTPMGLAVVSQVPDVVALFIASGVAINMPMSPKGWTLLTYAISNATLGELKPDQLETIRLLIGAGANVNAIAPSGEPPLAMAANAYTPSPELVRMLLKSGADARATDPNGYTVLTGRAASDLDILKLLVGAGADPYAHAKTGQTPLSFVCERRYELDGQPDPTAAERIAILHEPGTPIEPRLGEQRVRWGETPLLRAAIVHNPDCVKALFDAGADPDAPALIGAGKDDATGSVREAVARGAKATPDVYDRRAVALIEAAPRK